MGFSFNGSHSDAFNVCVQTDSMPYIASKRQTEVEVQGRDGQHVFEDGYNNMEIVVKCSVGDELIDRRTNALAIAGWLSGVGTLVFDYEPTIQYEVVKVVNNVEGNMRGYNVPITDFTVSFTVLPYREQTTYNEDLVFDPVVSGNTLELVNDGTYRALPIITLSGVAATVTIGTFTFVTLSGTVYIDCKNQLVYSVSGCVKTYRLASFSGSFLSIQPGDNDFAVSGTITSLAVEFDYKNTYL